MRKAFTLPELLIAVTISAILMTGILAFVGSGIGNAWKLKKEATLSTANTPFDDALGEIIGASPAKVSHTGIYSGEWYGSGMLLFQSGAHLPFSFIATKTLTGYCLDSTGVTNANGVIQKLVISRTESPFLSTSSSSYTLSGNTVLDSGNPIIGKDSGGSLFDAPSWSWSDPKTISLLHPKAILASGNGLFIADTGKDRVLAYSGGKIYSVLPPWSDISHPSKLNLIGNVLEVQWDGKTAKIQDNGTCSTIGNPLALDTSGISAFDTIKITANSSNVLLDSNTGAYQLDGNSSSSTGAQSNGISISFSSPITGSLLNVQNIQAPSLSPGSYYLTFSFFNAGNLQSTKFLPLTTCGDGDILTATGNTVEILPGSTYSSDTSITGFTGALPWSETVISPLPISNLAWVIDGNILTISYLEYTNYDCTLEKHEQRERILKIPLAP